MKSMVIGLFAETSLHPGTGQTAGAIDLPVAREVTTSYPVVVGSSLKGALRDKAEQSWGIGNNKVNAVFGSESAAGTLAVTDARLLLLPLRSLNGHYKWATCPYILERYIRDMKLAGIIADMVSIPEPVAGKAAALDDKRLYLEELAFDTVKTDLALLANEISRLIPHESVKKRLAGSLVVLNDNDFAYFAKYGLQVNARNVLNDKTKTSRNLWYEETLSPDTLFYAMMLARSGHDESIKDMIELFGQNPYLQVGGNETVGQGWCAISCLPPGGGL
jgi:CRISPR-associated protein Cmr4